MFIWYQHAEHSRRKRKETQLITAIQTEVCKLSPQAGFDRASQTGFES